MPILPVAFALPLAAQSAELEALLVKRSIAEDQTLALMLQGTDPDGDSLTWSVKQAPMHGAVVIEDAKDTVPVNYRPAENWNGSDYFIIEASDAMGGTSQLRVEVTVTAVNDAPANRKKPELIGDASLGQTLKVNVGEWDDSADGGAGSFSYSLQWLRSNSKNPESFTPIEGATGAEYQIKDSDQAAYLAVRVTALEAGDASTALSSTVISRLRRVGNQSPMLAVLTNGVPQESQLAIVTAKAAEVAAAKAAAKAAEETLTVSSFAFEGNVSLSSEELNAVVADYVGKPVGLSQLHEAAAKVSRLYRDKGVAIAEAFIPAQEIEGGKVRMVVMEGKLGEIKVAGNTNYSADYIREHLTEAFSNAPLSSASLEKGLLALNRSPGMNATSVLAPGTAPGAVDVNVQANDEGPVKGRLEYNNHGSDSISRDRYMASAEFININNSGTHLKASGVVGNQPQELGYYSLGLTFPINRLGTRMGLTTSQGSYQVTKMFADLGIKGDSSSTSLFVNHPFILESTRTLTAEFGVRGTDADFFVLGTTTASDQVRSAYASVNSEFDALGGRTSLSAELSQGLGSALGGMNNANNASRVGADNSFTKLRLSAAHNRAIARSWSFFAAASGQWSGTPVVSSEEWQIGGVGSVRGFAPGVASGDSGYQGTLELRYVSAAQTPWTAYSFIDYGLASRQNTLIGQNGSEALTGAGLGMSVRTKLPTGSGLERSNVELSLDVGWPVDGNAKLHNNAPIFNVKAAIEF